jgi:deoxyxylulose-5-phosphate synthase
MPEILLFTKPGCQKCEYVKERIPGGLSVTLVDMTTAQGLAEAAYYELLHRTTPVLVVDDVVYEGAIKIMDKLRTLADGPGKLD